MKHTTTARNAHWFLALALVLLGATAVLAQTGGSPSAPPEAPYSLTWSNATSLGREIQRGTLPKPQDDAVADMYFLAYDALTSSGYEHYEISNFALPGFRCRHNEAYWTGVPYLGLGPAAHSFIRNKRSWNIRDVQQYITVLSQNRLPVAGEEELRTDQILTERIALSLRRSEGLPVTELHHKRDRLLPLIRARLGRIEEGRFRLSERGFLLADAIALQLVV